MRIRFGYVAIAQNVPQGSPNKTITVKSLQKIADLSLRNSRLRHILAENLHTTIRILRYNAAHEIQLYRMTSKTVPLATHPITTGWNYIEEFQDEWRQIGDIIKKHKMRISAHPDHYTVLNSQKPEVLDAALLDLDYHANIFTALGLGVTPQLVLHIGGIYNSKQDSATRFIHHFSQLPEHIRLRLMLENDDKSYGAADVLALCQTLHCPMVLDIHHHTCHNNREDLAHLWANIANTWGNNVPKIHVSSPKNDKDFRSHAAFVKVADFLPFLKSAKELNRDFDVMVEAKEKDIAMFQLLDELQKVPGIKRVGNATIEYL